MNTNSTDKHQKRRCLCKTSIRQWWRVAYLQSPRRASQRAPRVNPETRARHSRRSFLMLQLLKAMCNQGPWSSLVNSDRRLTDEGGEQRMSCHQAEERRLVFPKSTAIRGMYLRVVNEVTRFVQVSLAHVLRTFLTPTPRQSPIPLSNDRDSSRTRSRHVAVV
jgi:hypothetical protein